MRRLSRLLGYQCKKRFIQGALSMIKDLLNIFKYTFAGFVFMAILVTVLILFFPYYLGKEFIQFFNNKKGETND